MKNFMDLSFPFIMDLYRSKVRAERDNDASAISSLSQNYPELFTTEFEELIASAKHVAVYLDHKYEENFSSIFEVVKEEKIGNLH